MHRSRCCLFCGQQVGSHHHVCSQLRSVLTLPMGWFPSRCLRKHALGRQAYADTVIPQSCYGCNGRFKQLSVCIERRNTACQSPRQLKPAGSGGCSLHGQIGFQGAHVFESSMQVGEQRLTTQLSRTWSRGHQVILELWGSAPEQALSIRLPTIRRKLAIQLSPLAPLPDLHQECS